MSDLPSQRDLLADARLAEHATSATPAWLWRTDGTCLLWANAVGAAIFDVPDIAALSARRFGARDQAAAQILRLAGTLPHGGAPRLERLRGFGAGFAGALLCSCTRIVVAGHVPAILVVALAPAGPRLTLAERTQRLFASLTNEAAVAAFSPRGELLFATPAAQTLLGPGTNLHRLGADDIVAQAHTHGQARGEIAQGAVTFQRLGRGDDTVLAATFVPFASPAVALPQTIADAVPDEETAAHTHVAEQPIVPAPQIDTSAVAPVAEAPIPPETSDETATPPVPEFVETLAETISPPLPPVDIPLESAAAITAMPSDDDASSNAPVNEVSPPTSEPAPTIEDVASPLGIETAVGERRHPLRFVWQMDRDSRFTLGSDEFTEVIGPRTAIALGRPWADIAAELALDPEGQVARAVATRDTWSGITVSWPADGTSERLKVELSGLPIYDRDREFLGYRGFGVCRDVARINVLAQMRRGAAVFSAPLASAETSAADAPIMPTEPVASPPPLRTVEERPALSLVPAARNVVPFRTAAGAGAETRAPVLSPVEHNAFRELARQLTARLKDEVGSATPETIDDEPDTGITDQVGIEAAVASLGLPGLESRDAATDRPLIDRLPVGVLVYRFDQPLYANPAFLAWAGKSDLDAFAEAGGLDNLLVDAELAAPAGAGIGRTIAIAADGVDKTPAEGRLFSVPWEGDPAHALVLLPAAARAAPAEAAPQQDVAAVPSLGTDAGDIASILDAAIDGVVAVDRDGRIMSANRGALALLAGSPDNLVGAPLLDLFAPESQRVVRHQFDLILRGDVATTDGREVAARARNNGHVPLLMTIGRLGTDGERYCVVLRDITAWKTHEHELIAAKLSAERASKAKSDFLAKVSHEIRTPLNSIIGFSEVMIDERFGPIGNERYREYIKDIRASGEHVVSLLNDLLDLAKIEAGKLDLTFVGVGLNDMVQACVALMQPLANREHILIRTSLAQNLKPVVADAKSVRQIMLNLLSNSIKFTGAGGQVIVSTAATADGGVMLRVRDTGIGMNEADLAAAMEPFRQLATASRWGSAGTGLGLPLTKALTEANRAEFAITSKIDDGTLVEIGFPPARVVAD